MGGVDPENVKECRRWWRRNWMNSKRAKGNMKKKKKLKLKRYREPHEKIENDSPRNTLDIQGLKPSIVAEQIACTQTGKHPHNSDATKCQYRRKRFPGLRYSPKMSYFTLRWSTIFHNWRSIYSSKHPASIMNWVRNHVPLCFHSSKLFPPSFSHNLLCPFYAKFCPLVNGSLNYFLQLVLSPLQLYPSETLLCAH